MHILYNMYIYICNIYIYIFVYVYNVRVYIYIQYTCTCMTSTGSNRATYVTWASDCHHIEVQGACSCMSKPLSLPLPDERGGAAMQRSALLRSLRGASNGAFKGSLISWSSTEAISGKEWES